MGGSAAYERPAIAGSGMIACGLAACATQTGTVRLLARSDASAWRAEEVAQGEARKLDRGAPERIKVTTQTADLADCDLVVEAIAEDADAKVELLSALAATAPDAHLATTTSSLSIGELGERSGCADRFFGLHVFSPVARMELIELCLPAALADGVARPRPDLVRSARQDRDRGAGPDRVRRQPAALPLPLRGGPADGGDAGWSAADVDSCMQLGAGHPMGPLRLLDFVGLDVAAAIGESLDRDGAGGGADVVPALIERDGRRREARAGSRERDSSSTERRARTSGGPGAPVAGLRPRSGRLLLLELVDPPGHAAAPPRRLRRRAERGHRRPAGRPGRLVAGALPDRARRRPHLHRRRGRRARPAFSYAIRVICHDRGAARPRRVQPRCRAPARRDGRPPGRVRERGARRPL